MRIFQITPSFFPKFGGIEKVVYEYSLNLSKLDNDVIVLTDYFSEDHTTINHKQNFTVVRIPKIGLNLRFILNLYLTILFIRKIENSIIHLHGIRSVLTYLTLLFSFNNNNIFLSPHYHSLKLNILSKYISTPILRYLLTKCNGFVFASKFERNLFFRDFNHLSQYNTTLIRYGTEWKNNPKKYNGRKPIRLLMVNRLIWYKQTEIAIEFLEKHPDFNLTIVGTGKEKSKLVGLIEKHDLEERCRIISNITRDRLHALYEDSDLFLSFSKFEAFGISVQEALTHGIPCIVNSGSALNEFEDPNWCKVLNIKDEFSILKPIIIELLYKERNVPYKALTWFETSKELDKFYQDF